MRILIALLMLQQSTIVQVYIPTFKAVDIARRVAKDLGFRTEDPEYYFDRMRSKGDKPAIPGYVDMGFYGHNNLLQEFAISETTGQIVDPRTCQVFEFPDLESFQRTQQRQSGLRPKTQDELRSDLGCDHLTFVRNPIIRSGRPAKTPKN